MVSNLTNKKNALQNAIIELLKENGLRWSPTTAESTGKAFIGTNVLQMEV